MFTTSNWSRRTVYALRKILRENHIPVEGEHFYAHMLNIKGRTDAARECGLNYFDHADIYGGGKCEELFGNALADDGSFHREDMIIQSKCGIRKIFLTSPKNISSKRSTAA